MTTTNMSALPAALLALAAGALCAPIAEAQCQTATLVASDVSQGMKFGVSIDVDGDRLVVGAPGTKVTEGGEGAAYVFRRVAGAWIEEATLVASDAAGDGQFGVSVAILGDWIAVGAPYSHFTGMHSGVVYMFRFDGSIWIQETQLVPVDIDPEDNFGLAVALDGQRLLASSPRDSQGPYRSGAAYVFRLDAGGWVEEAKLKHSLPHEEDNVGTSVALRGDAAVLGSPFNELSDAGAAYVFRQTEAGWVQEQRLAALDQELGAGFGYDVDIDSDLVIAGTPFSGLNDNGAAYIFRQQATGWVQEKKLFALDIGENDNFGQSVALEGTVAVVGSPNDFDFVSHQGSVTSFSLAGEQWIADAKLIADKPAASDEMGTSLAMDGESIVTGAAENKALGPDTGRAFVYSRAADLVPYGAGLAGTGEYTPRLSGFGCPFLGAFTDVKVADGVGGAPGFLALGTAQGAFPFLGGTLLVDGLVALVPHFLGGDPGVKGKGTAVLTFPAPTEPALVGATVYAQGGYLDAGAVQGISMSNGLRIVIGQP